jgi:hypothetical protein
MFVLLDGKYSCKQVNKLLKKLVKNLCWSQAALFVVVDENKNRSSSSIVCVERKSGTTYF